MFSSCRYKFAGIVRTRTYRLLELDGDHIDEGVRNVFAFHKLFSDLSPDANKLYGETRNAFPIWQRANLASQPTSQIGGEGKA